MANGISMGEKIEMTALQLLYIISGSIDEFCNEHYGEDNCFNSLGFAKDKVIELFEEKEKHEDNN